MEKIKHTPGPWHTRCMNAYGDFEVIAPKENSADGFLVVRTDVSTIRPSEVERIHAEHNARLIAAAPELLGVLQNISDFWGNPDVFRQPLSAYARLTGSDELTAVDMVRAAIAKALDIR